jgi:hypothetical protein
MAAEFAWHSMVQNWDYRNDLHLFNGLMYVFMTASFVLLSWGLRKGKVLDALMLILLALVPLSHFWWGIKEIIWIAQLAALTVLTYRSWIVLEDPLVFLFPVFSFGVNMMFSMMLFITKEPVYHILHDLPGTLMGLTVYGVLVYLNPWRRGRNG